MKIYGWPADSAGCAFYRVAEPLRALALRGHHVHMSDVKPAEWRDTADIIIGQRVCLPGATTRWQKLAKQGRATLVFEIDDDLFDIHPSSKKAYTFFAQDGIRKNLELNMRVADVVTVTTNYLAERLSPYSDNIVVLPNCIPEALLEHEPTRSDDHITIGWGGSATHQVDWTGPDEHIARFITRTPDTELHVMGWTPQVLWNRTPADRRRSTGWIHDVNQLHRAIDYDIGVIPLRDLAFNRSKSSIKHTELCALGIPAVISNAGPYEVDVRDGVTGLLVRKPADWARHLADLAGDEALRTALGKSAKEWAATRTMEGNAHLWEQAYA